MATNKFTPKTPAPATAPATETLSPAPAPAPLETQEPKEGATLQPGATLEPASQVLTGSLGSVSPQAAALSALKEATAKATESAGLGSVEPAGWYTTAASSVRTKAGRFAGRSFQGRFFYPEDSTPEDAKHQLQYLVDRGFAYYVSNDPT